MNSELIDDITKIEFVTGNLGTSYKYKALIPRDVWNKWRPEKELKKKEFKEVNFGKPGYQQYKDLIGSWSDFDHLDKKRRANYRARHSAIKYGDRYSYLVPFTNEFFSYWLMW